MMTPKGSYRGCLELALSLSKTYLRQFNGISIKQTALLRPLMKPVCEPLLLIFPSFKIETRLSKAEHPSFAMDFFVRCVTYGERSGRTLKGRSSYSAMYISFFRQKTVYMTILISNLACLKLKINSYVCAGVLMSNMDLNKAKMFSELVTRFGTAREGAFKAEWTWEPAVPMLAAFITNNYGRVQKLFEPIRVFRHLLRFYTAPMGGA
jgi:hypothetical protein